MTGGSTGTGRKWGGSVAFGIKAAIVTGATAISPEIHDPAARAQHARTGFG